VQYPLAYAPQFVKVCRTRSTEDISLGMFLVMVLGIMLWLLYACFREMRL
jgi:MtN3 and saliva related transmembrane protein